MRRLLDVIELAMSERLVVDVSCTRRRSDGAIGLAAYQQALVTLTERLRPYGHVLLDVQTAWDAPLSANEPASALSAAELAALVAAVHAADPSRLVIASNSAALSPGAAGTAAAAAGLSAAAYHPAETGTWVADTATVVADLRAAAGGRPVYLQEPRRWADGCGGSGEVAGDYVSALGAARAAGAGAWALHGCVSDDLRQTTLRTVVEGRPATRTLLEMPPSRTPTALRQAANTGTWEILVNLRAEWVRSGRGTVTVSPADVHGIVVRCGTEVDAATCTGTFARGTTVTLTATPVESADGRYSWGGWRDTPGCGPAPSRTVTLWDDTTATAAFEYTPPPEVRYYHVDPLGSVRVVTNATATTVTRHDYLAFGEEWPAPQGTETHRFTGKEHDSETGLDYFGARYYRADLGRFTTVDPVLDQQAALTDPQRWNRYAYVRNNPLKYVDPDGRDAIYVNYPNFPITLPGTHSQLPLGHAAVIAVDEKTGATRYYEYGRYDSDFGNVERRSVPDLVMGKDGRPTAESVERLKQFVSKNLGKGTAAEFTYYDDADSKKVIAFAEQRMHDDKRQPYSWSPLGMNTCKTFAADAVEAGRPQAPWWKRWLGLKRDEKDPQ